jgi:hypothetical protein
MVVLTDGAENHGSHTRRYISDVADLISSLNGRVFAIGLGRAEVLNPAALQALCSGNNGYMLMTGDLTPDATYRLAKYYQQIFAGVTNHDIVLDPQGYVGPGPEIRIPFWLTEADISAKAILLSPAPYAIRFRLETPTGDIIDPTVAAAHPTLSFEAAQQVTLYRVGLPVPLGANIAHAGRWYARLSLDGNLFRKYLSALDNQPALFNTAAAHGILYNFNAHAYSNLRMRGNLSQTSNEPGASMTVRAVLTEYGLPVVGRATCQAEITLPDNTQITLAMTESQPGVFEGTITANLAGIYTFRIMAAGKTFRGSPFTREQVLTGAVWRGGDDKPPEVKDDPNRYDERVCALITCLFRNRAILELLRKQGIDPAELRRCFSVFCRKPGPNQPPQLSLKAVEDQLRGIALDEDTLRAVAEIIKPQLE